MTLWRPSDAPRTKPVWQPSGAAPAQPDLTDDEQARLAVYRDVYPHSEWLDQRGLDHCRFIRYLHSRGHYADDV